MDVLLAAIAIAWAAGAQNEQSKLNLGPAEREALRERARHEKAVQKIAAKHGVNPDAVTLPDTFAGRGYRSPLGRVADLFKRREVTDKDAGRRAVETYRERETVAGRADPAPLVAPNPAHVLVPRPPAHPPAIPPMPAHPPTVGTGPDLTKKPSTGPEGASKAPGGAEVSTGPEKPADGPAGAVPGPRGDKETPPPTSKDTPGAATGPVTDDKPVTDGGTPPVTPDATSGTDTVTAPPSDVTAPPSDVTAPPSDVTAPAAEGPGRMAAEVSYESVAEESDELNLMCDDDLAVYVKVQDVCKREASKGDTLVPEIREAGFGERIVAWMVSCKEKYGTLAALLEELRGQTMAQSESVWLAKGRLMAGQGVYADIARDMESVATRDAYISDRIDGDDADAHREDFEIRSAS